MLRFKKRFRKLLRAETGENQDSTKALVLLIEVGRWSWSWVLSLWTLNLVLLSGFMTVIGLAQNVR